MQTAMTATDCTTTVNRKYTRTIEYIFGCVFSRYTAIDEAGRLNRHICLYVFTLTRTLPLSLNLNRKTKS